jgi:hypothetical protein
VKVVVLSRFPMAVAPDKWPETDVRPVAGTEPIVPVPDQEIAKLPSLAMGIT